VTDPTPFDTSPRRPRGRIAIAGIGLISPLGTGAWPTLAALLAGRTLADRQANLPPGLDPVALVRALGCVASAQHASDDPAVELAERAAREALTEAGVSPVGLPCFIGTSKGAVGALPGRSAVMSHHAAAAVALGPCGHLTHALRRRLGLGLTQHVVAACASSLHALHVARRELLAGSSHDACLVVTAESALLPAFIHSYRRLGVLAPQDDYVGRPLDRRRHGFMLAEVGAAVVLRRVERIKPGMTELIDTAVAAEAHDLIRPSPDMPSLRRVALQLAAHGPVDVLHPHAPGTTDHDATELDVLHHSFGSGASLYAAKGALGHSLGAAGLSSLVLACLIARTGKIPPMPWLASPIDHPLFEGATGAPAALLRHVVIAAGFAGHVAAARLHRVTA
jgi:3-oxoacyl-[acyl-carrier-protein] synthase II